MSARSWVAATAFLGFGLVACSNPTTPNARSSEHPANEIGFTVSIRSNGVDVVADVSLSAQGTPCELSGDDRLVLRSSDGAERALESAGGTFEAYVAQIESPSTTISLVFERAGGETHASTFELPPPFVVAPPASPSRASPMQLAWTADPASPSSLEATGPCLPARFTRAFAVDPGAFAFQPADFTPGGECTLVVVVTRSRKATGAGDLGAGGALADLEQIRTLVLETTP